MACFAGLTPEQVLHVAYHLVFIGGPALLILWQTVGISRASDEYAAAMKRQMR